MADDQNPTVRETILAMYFWPPDALDFDPLDYRTWCQRLRDLACEVEHGLAIGDLAPLAAYLRDGFPLPGWLSLRLADAIDPHGDGRFVIKRGWRKSGEQGERVAFARHSRNANIGLYVCYLMNKHGPGTYDAAIEETKRRFGIGKKSTNPNTQYMKQKAHAFDESGSIHPFYVTFFEDLYWKHYPFPCPD